MKFYLKIFKLFSKKNQINFFLIFLLQLFHASLEIFSFILIFPILKVLVDPNFIDTLNLFLNQNLNINIFSKINSKDFVFISSGLIVSLYFIKSIIILVINFYIFRFIKNIKIYLSDKFLRSNLFNDHLNLESSSVIIRTAFKDINSVCENVVTSFLNSITDIVLLIFILCFMFYIQPIGSTISFLSFATLVFLYSKITSGKIKKLTFIYQKLNSKLIESIQNIHRNIKEIKIFKKEIFFLNIYQQHLTQAENATNTYKFFHTLPKVIYEFIGIIIIIAFFLITLETTFAPQEVISQIGIVAICAFRIIPSASKISANIINMKYSKASVDVLYDSFKKLKNKFDTKKFNNKNFLKLNFYHVSFSYKNPYKLVFKDINLQINKGEKIAIVGRSGVGKTTFLEIMCGLMPLDTGKIIIHSDNNETFNTKVDFFTYVSQNVILVEDTIKSNIAFGIEEKLIDNSKISKVCEVANLSNFINGLKNKLDTQIGELGSRLSGGQKQRISIARALYFNREIIILDEATSALDFQTEKEILNNIKINYPLKTIIIISHRKTSLNFCDRILNLEDYQISEKF